MSAPTLPAPPAPSPSRRRRLLGAALRWGGSAAALAYVALRVPLADAGEALARLPARALVLAVAGVVASVLIAALRWRALLGAYGAARPPPLGRLVHLYGVAFFYNNYLPGAVAGDVVRGVVTRDALGAAGLPAALAVVFVERALGLFALFALLGVGLLATGGGAGGTGGAGAAGAAPPAALWWWTALGGAGALGLVLLIPSARRLAPRLARLPGPLARLAAPAARLPALARPGAFAVAAALSLASQAAIALAGHALLAALAPIPVAASLLVVPLAAATAFLPITVGGAGAREAVFVGLCGALFHMPRADALAASLALWLAHLAVGAAGGALALRRGWRAAG